MFQIVPLNRHSRADRERFIQVPYHIYKGDPFWVPPLIMTEHIKLSNAEPFYDHGETQLFVAVREGRDVGRIAATKNQVHNDVHQDKVGFFGFFECENDPQAAKALLESAAEWVRQQGLDTLRGPVNLSTNHTIGLLISGDPGAPMVDMTYNPPYYQNLIENTGFTKSMDVVAHRMDVSNPATIERLEKMARRVESRNAVTTRPINMKKFRAEIDILKEIYNAAWEKNWGFVPLNDKEFDHSAEDLKMVVDPELVRFIFVDGKPAGFIGTVLNLNEIVIKLGGHLFPFGILKLLLGKPKIKSLRLMLMGVKKEYRKHGLETVLYSHSLKHALTKGYTSCENSWLLETNDMVIRASEFMGGREYRRYRIYDKSLSPKQA